MAEYKLNQIREDWENAKNVNKSFNDKWNEHLEEGHYGMSIGDKKVADYLDREFTALKIFVPDFKYSQLKIKFGRARLYITSDSFDTEKLEKFISILEKRIDEILAERKAV